MARRRGELGREAAHGAKREALALEAPMEATTNGAGRWAGQGEAGPRDQGRSEAGLGLAREWAGERWR